MTKIGTVIMTPAALISSHRSPRSVRKFTSPTGSVTASRRVRISEKRNSFQVRMKQKIDEVRMPGAAIGRTISLITRKPRRAVDHRGLLAVGRDRVDDSP